MGTVEFDADMLRILERCGAPQSFRVWLIHNSGVQPGGVATPEDYAVMTPTEEGVRPSTTLASGRDTFQKLTRNEEGEVHFKEVVIDEVGLFELCKRLGAYVWTVAYLSMERMG